MKFFLVTTTLTTPGSRFDRALVDVHDRRADFRRTHDDAMQHARHADVLDELELRR